MPDIITIRFEWAPASAAQLELSLRTDAIRELMRSGPFHPRRSHLKIVGQGGRLDEWSGSDLLVRVVVWTELNWTELVETRKLVATKWTRFINIIVCLLQCSAKLKPKFEGKMCVAQQEARTEEDLSWMLSRSNVSAWFRLQIYYVQPN